MPEHWVCGGNSYANSNSNTHTDAYAYAYAYADSNAYTNADADPDCFRLLRMGWQNLLPKSLCHIGHKNIFDVCRLHGGPNSDAHPYAHPDPDTHPYANTDPDTDTHGYTYQSVLFTLLVCGNQRWQRYSKAERRNHCSGTRASQRLAP